MRRSLFLALTAILSFLAVPFVIVPCVLLMLGLGLVALLGLIWGLLGLVIGNWLMSAECFGVGAGAFTVIVFIWDRVLAARDMVRRSRDASIPTLRSLRQ